MFIDPEKASQAFAKNLGTIRKNRKLSQASLAKLSGLPKSTLSHLESGESNPTLDTIVRIASALGVTIEELISRPVVTVTHMTAQDMPHIRTGTKGTQLVRLLPDPFPELDLYYLELSAGTQVRGTLQVNRSMKYFYCTRGQILVRIAGEKYELNKGDALFFPADEPHSYQNDTSALAEAVIAASYLGNRATAGAPTP